MPLLVKVNNNSIIYRPETGMAESHQRTNRNCRLDPGNPALRFCKKLILAILAMHPKRLYMLLRLSELPDLNCPEGARRIDSYRLILARVRILIACISHHICRNSSKYRSIRIHLILLRITTTNSSSSSRISKPNKLLLSRLLGNLIFNNLLAESITYNSGLVTIMGILKPAPHLPMV